VTLCVLLFLFEYSILRVARGWLIWPIPIWYDIHCWYVFSLCLIIDWWSIVQKYWCLMIEWLGNAFDWKVEMTVDWSWRILIYSFWWWLLTVVIHSYDAAITIDGRKLYIQYCASDVRDKLWRYYCCRDDCYLFCCCSMENLLLIRYQIFYCLTILLCIIIDDDCSVIWPLHWSKWWPDDGMTVFDLLWYWCLIRYAMTYLLSVRKYGGTIDMTVLSMLKLCIRLYDTVFEIDIQWLFITVGEFRDMTWSRPRGWPVWYCSYRRWEGHLLIFVRWYYVWFIILLCLFSILLRYWWCFITYWLLLLLFLIEEYRYSKCVVDEVHC